MGTYLNPGKKSYEFTVNSEIFVDKTEMLLYLNSVVNTNQRYVSVSRPRRFGKTIAADMLTAYYGKGADRELFDKLNISSHDDWYKYLGGFDVIRLAMTDFIKANVEVSSSIDKIQKRVFRDLEKQYPDVDYYDPDDLISSMEDVYNEYGRQFVLVIDEWDAVFRERRQDDDGHKLYLDFLRDWLKDKDYVALAYMTGILPIKKYGKHSALNMFDEYSMIAPMQLASYTGFTEDEVRNLCVKYGRSFEKMEEWYDGYDLSDVIPPDPNYEKQKELNMEIEAEHYSIYSPLSVVKAVSTGIIQDYWNKTENYEALAQFINMNMDGLKDAVALMMDGGRFQVDISTYQNDMTSFSCRDDVLALLINLGYLGYDMETREVFIPNKEILEEFKASTKDSVWADTFKAFESSLELLQATWDVDEAKVAELVEDAHNRASNKTYNDETALSYGIQLAYYAAQKYYTTVLGLDTGKGYADIAYLPAPRFSDKPALLIELKYGKSADVAMDQIRRQKYMDRFEHYRGNMLIIGLNYNKDFPNDDPKFKHHTCRIERM